MVGVVGSSPIAPTNHKPKQIADLLGLFAFLSALACNLDGFRGYCCMRRALPTRDGVSAVCIELQYCKGVQYCDCHRRQTCNTTPCASTTVPKQSACPLGCGASGFGSEFTGAVSGSNAAVSRCTHLVNSGHIEVCGVPGLGATIADVVHELGETSGQSLREGFSLPSPACIGAASPG